MSDLVITFKNPRQFATTVIGMKGDTGPAGPGAVLPTIVATEDLPAYCIVRSGGKKANSAITANWNQSLGIVPATILNTFSGNFQTTGEITYSGWAWTPGDNIFLNGIVLSKTPPTSGFILKVGVAKTATSIELLNFSPILL